MSKPIQFKDLNFKFSVISELHNLGFFKEEAERIKDEKSDFDDYSYEPIKEVYEFYKNLKISQELLDKIEALRPDGGDYAYDYMMNNWDGEDDQFDIHSIEGIEHLTNLKEFYPISMLDKIDYSPLLKLKKLEKVNIDWMADSPENKKVLKELQKRGITIISYINPVHAHTEEPFKLEIIKAGVFEQPPKDDFISDDLKFTDESGNVAASKNVYFGVVLRTINNTDDNITVEYELKHPSIVYTSGKITSGSIESIKCGPGRVEQACYFYFLEDYEMVEGEWVFIFTGPENIKAEHKFDVVKPKAKAEKETSTKKTKTETDDFKDFDFDSFWQECEYAQKNYISQTPTPEIVKSIEKSLGFKLPQSYLNFMQKQNGGYPTKDTFYIDDDKDREIGVRGFFGIGNEKPYSLGSPSRGSRFWIEEWEYPNDGIYICDCPSGGHDMILLDYSNCGKDGEPEVVHVDQEGDYEKTLLAKDFSTFVRQLREMIDDSEEMKVLYTNRVQNGKFSKLLSSLCENLKEIPEIEKCIRSIAFKILQEKTVFALHADELSYLMYDVQFLLFTNSNKVISQKEYLAEYEKMLALDGEFTTDGYAPAFVEDWLKKRVIEKKIMKKGIDLKFSEEYKAALVRKIKGELETECTSKEKP